MESRKSMTKPIGKITSQDNRVSFIGDVLERSQNRMVVGDDSGEIEVVYDSIDVPGSKVVRVTGRVFTPLHVIAESIQDFSGFDVALYERIRNAFK